MKINMLALIIALIGALLAALSQYLLKLSANRKYKSKLYEYLNPLVISAYSILVIITLANLFAMRFLPISLMPIIESTSYVHIALIAHFMLKESLTKQKLLGLGLIVLGVIIAGF